MKRPRFGQTEKSSGFVDGELTGTGGVLAGTFGELTGTFGELTGTEHFFYRIYISMLHIKKNALTSI